jgi:hypothetical protein
VEIGKTARFPSGEELLKFLRCKHTALGEVQRMHKQTVEEWLSRVGGTLPAMGAACSPWAFSTPKVIAYSFRKCLDGSPGYWTSDSCLADKTRIG